MPVAHPVVKSNVSPDIAKYLGGLGAKSLQVENHSFSGRSRGRTHTHTHRHTHPMCLARSREGTTHGRKALTLTFTEWLRTTSLVVGAAAS